MLSDLTRADWLEALQLPPEWAPSILWLRGTRQLGVQLAEHRKLFGEVAPMTVPNGLFDDFVIGRLDGTCVAYASVYGSSMAIDMVHLAGVLGARLVLLTGCCGILQGDFAIGDLLVATEAETASGRVKARMYGRDMSSLPGPGKLHFGACRSTEGILGTRRETMRSWAEQGLWGVDLETGPVYQAAAHFDMDRVALLYGYDHPLGEQHHLHHDDLDLRLRRAQGNAYLNGLARSILSDYLKATASSDRSSDKEPLANRSTSE